jgi:hypothetical protein
MKKYMFAATVVLAFTAQIVRADLSYPDRQLYVATTSWEFNPDKAEAALAAGGNVNAQNDQYDNSSLLIMAVRGFAPPAAVKWLLAHGADMSLTDENGKTALDWANQLHIVGQPDGRRVMAALRGAAMPAADANGNAQPQPAPVPAPPVAAPAPPVAAPAPPRQARPPVPPARMIAPARDPDGPMSEIDRRLLVVITGWDFHPDEAEAVLARGADVNARNDQIDDSTLLIMAVRGFAPPAAVKWLMAHGADPSLRDENGKSAIDWAYQLNITGQPDGRRVMKALRGGAGG